jgi:sarcosine oxidase subunit delta
MRIACPHCGERGNDEFSYVGAADLARPAAEAPAEAWHAYVYRRENPAGPHSELWQHAHGCRRWLVVTRDTRTHTIAAVADAARA